MEEMYEELITKSEYLFYIEENDVNNKYKNKIYINPDLIRYELLIEKDEKDQIILSINEKNINGFSKYQAILYPEKFLNLSPYFKLLKFVNEIFFIDSIYIFIKEKLDNNIIKRNNKFNSSEFINIINLNNSSVYISHLNEPDDKIYFIFNINYCNLKTEEIKIELEKIEKIDDKDEFQIIQFLLKNKYKYVQRLNSLTKELKKTQKLTKKYENLLDKCNGYFGQDMKIKMSFLDMGIDTDILMSSDDYHFLIRGVSKILKKKISKLNQIYKASCNGDNINAFHENCKNVPNTLILIITDEKMRFGGFTQAIWDSSNKYKFDDKAFLFSLDNKEIYPILDKYKDKAINCREDFYAPIFGEDIYLFDGFFSSQLNKTNEKYYNYSKSKIMNPYKLSGQEYFTVTEMEIYQVIFRNK